MVLFFMFKFIGFYKLLYGILLQDILRKYVKFCYFLEGDELEEFQCEYCDKKFYNKGYFKRYMVKYIGKIGLNIQVLVKLGYICNYIYIIIQEIVGYF